MKNIFYLSLIFIFVFSASNISALSLTVHVPEKYTDVVAGERLYFEIEVKYPENPQRKDLRLEYEILTSGGELVAQSKVLKAVETQASFIDFIVIPETSDSGLHIINIKITDYDTLSEEVSSSFKVQKTGIDIVTIYFIVILGGILIVSILSLVIIISRRK